MAKVSIKGLDKAAVFAALYNRAQPQMMGFLQYDPNPMSLEQAREQLGLGDDNRRVLGVTIARELYFDYVMGRVMKVDLSGDEFDSWGFDRDNGEGAAASAIAALIATGSPVCPDIVGAHVKGVLKALEEFEKATQR